MKYAGKLKNLKKAGSGLYNGMIHPISNYQVKGAIGTKAKVIPVVRRRMLLYWRL